MHPEHSFSMPINDPHNSDWQQLSDYCVPGIVLRVSHLLAHLIHIISLSGKKPGFGESKYLGWVAQQNPHI